MLNLDILVFSESLLGCLLIPPHVRTEDLHLHYLVSFQLQLIAIDFIQDAFKCEKAYLWVLTTPFVISRSPESPGTPL